MKGRVKLPVTEHITLLTEESQWSMLNRGLINKLNSEAIVKTSEGKEVKIKIVFEKAIAPKDKQIISQFDVEGALNNSSAKGLARSHEFLHDFLSETTWMLFGRIAGEDPVDIVVVCYTAIGITIYSQKLKSEKKEAFFGPRLN